MREVLYEHWKIIFGAIVGSAFPSYFTQNTLEKYFFIVSSLLIVVAFILTYLKEKNPSSQVHILTKQEGYGGEESSYTRFFTVNWGIKKKKEKD